jgi:hypothetical protein
MENIINYEHLFLNNMELINNTLVYKIYNKLRFLSINTQKWLIDMELIEIYLKQDDLSITLNDSYKKIYIVINELKPQDDLIYHFVCKTESTINGFILKPLNKFKFNTKTMCLTIPQLTFSFYTYNNELSQIEKINVDNIDILPLELLISFL